MRYTGLLDTLLIRGHSWKCVRAFTLVELLIILAITGTLAGIALPTYNGYIDKARGGTAAVDIREMDVAITRIRAEQGAYPATLAAAGFATLLDPWGRPYQYLVIGGVVPEPAGVRKDHSVHPLNSDFDLYSMGKDGNSLAPLTAAASHDDIVRANNGRFVGPASDY